MRKYVGHPIDWLTVMNASRWNTKGELAELMNTRCRINLFKVYSYQDKVLQYVKRKIILGLDLVMIIDDLTYLEEEGYVENRTVYYDKQGNVFPKSMKEHFFTRDGSGAQAPSEKEFDSQYSLRDEYRRIEKGEGADRNRNSPKLEVDVTSSSPHGIRA